MPTLDIGDQAIHCFDRGAGEALVIFADDLHASCAYDGEAARLADRFRVRAFDVPGTGASTRCFGSTARTGARWSTRTRRSCAVSPAAVAM